MESPVLSHTAWKVSKYGVFSDPYFFVLSFPGWKNLYTKAGKKDHAVLFFISFRLSYKQSLSPLF